MKKTLAVLILIASACTEPVTAPVADQSADEAGGAVALAGEAAIEWYTKVLESELASPRLLELNAAFKDITIGERRNQIRDAIGMLASIDASSGPCDDSARFTAVSTTIYAVEPLFPGLPWAVAATGVNHSDKPAIHRTYSYIGADSGVYPGYPPIQGEGNYAEADSTSTMCETVWVVSTPWIYVSGDDFGCWWAYGQSMHRLVKEGDDDELYTDTAISTCNGRRKIF